MNTSTRTRWSEVGALTSAGTVAATILCCLPFATGIVGASVAADAKWDEAPTSLIHWGRTIVAGRETLRQDFERLFGAAQPAPRIE